MSILVLCILMLITSFSKLSARRLQVWSKFNEDVIYCQTSKGKFRILLNPLEAPSGVRVLREMVRQDWMTDVAFFRKNNVATQFGVGEKIYKFDWSRLNLTSHEEWRDPSPESDRKKRPHWPRGVMYMVGGTHMVVVLKDGKHYQGKNDFEAIVGRIPEEDMKTFDALYAYNDIIDNPKGGPGPDQVDIYRHGWKYLNEQFPLVDRIYSCQFEPFPE